MIVPKSIAVPTADTATMEIFSRHCQEVRSSGLNHELKASGIIRFIGLGNRTGSWFIIFKNMYAV